MFLSVSNCSFNVDRSHVPSPPWQGGEGGRRPDEGVIGLL